MNTYASIRAHAQSLAAYLVDRHHTETSLVFDGMTVSHSGHSPLLFDSQRKRTLLFDGMLIEHGGPSDVPQARKRRFDPSLCLLGLTVVLTATTLGVKYLLYQHRKNPIGNTWVSRYMALLMRWTKQPKYPARAIRNEYTATSVVHTGQLPGHTHPASAALRNAAVNTVELFARKIGYEPYFVQMSSNDAKNQRAGCRTWYWDKDINVDFKAFNLRGSEIVCMIDVDHYIDMPRMLANYVRPYLIATFQPTNVAKDKGEYSFTFDADGLVDYRVSGGGGYKHLIWHYGPDTLLVSTATFLGLGHTVAAYNVDRKQTDDHHQIVLLTPIRTFWSPIFDMSPYLSGNPLRRLNVVMEGGHTRMRIQDKEGMRVVVGRVDSYASAEVPASTDDTIANITRISKTDVTLASVKVAAGITDQTAASALTLYHRAQISPETMVATTADAVRGYQFSPQEYDQDAKPSIIPYMNPIIDPAIAPDQTRANEEQSIRGRLLDVRSTTKITPFISAAIRDFVTRFVPESQKHTGVPKEIDEVRERQNRPTQLRMLDEASLSSASSSDDPLKAFMKKEPYTKVTDPRNISTVPTLNKLHYARYTYAFAEQMRTQPWYAFGKTPLEIATRVGGICLKAKFINNTDLSRFDGHVSEVFRTLEQEANMEFFNPKYHAELQELMTKQYNRRGFTRFGVSYFSWLTRASGSGETADANSLDNAFIAFLGFRLMGKTAQEAFDALGIYGGDDGLTADLNSDAYVLAAKQCGQELEIDQVDRYGHGVSFLSREFTPFVWEGDIDSCCDIVRTLTKLPTTVALPSNVTPVMKLGEKLQALACTDYNTPIIHELIIAYNRHIALSTVKPCGATDSWWAKFKTMDQFPNANVNDWMNDYIARKLPTFDHNMFRLNIQGSQRDVTVLLRMRSCVPPRGPTAAHKLASVIDGDILATSKSVALARPPPLDSTVPTKHWVPAPINTNLPSTGTMPSPSAPPAPVTPAAPNSAPVSTSKPPIPPKPAALVAAVSVGRGHMAPLPHNTCMSGKPDDMDLDSPTTPTTPNYSKTESGYSPSSPIYSPTTVDDLIDSFPAVSLSKCATCGHNNSAGYTGVDVCLCNITLPQTAKPAAKAATKTEVDYCISAKKDGLKDGKCAWEVRTGKKCNRRH